jgi:hypothetical protein
MVHRPEETMMAITLRRFMRDGGGPEFFVQWAGTAFE